MTPDRLNEIRALLIGATPGPWRWFGNTNVHDLYLATVHHGRRFVMQFGRWGMRDAAPLFQVQTPSGSGVMVRADEMARYEVPYRKDVVGIDHPDARLIEAAPSAIADLLEEVDRLAEAEREMDGVRADLAALRIEYKAHAALLDITRRDRDEARQETSALRAQNAELTRLGASLHKATAKGREMERADVVAWMANHRATEIAGIDPDAADIIYRMEHDIEHGAHEGAGEKA